MFQTYFQYYGLVIISSNVLMYSFAYYTMGAQGFDGFAFSIITYSMFQIFITCLGAQFLTTETDNVSQHLYETPWHEMGVSNRRILLNLMAGCQQKRVLSAGSLYYFTLESFVNVSRPTLLST